MPDVHESLARAAKWIDRYERQGQSEANTKAGLIEPVLEGLGWEIHNPDEVSHEYRRKASDNPVDYALLLRRTPRLFVEAKSIGANLDDPKWTNQMIAYATAAGVAWVVLTNGDEWRIYNSHAPVPLERKLFQKVKVSDDLDDAAAVLALIGKDNMSGDRIEELWRAYFVDQQVHSILRELFSGGEPVKELVLAVRHRSTDLSPKDIRTSLARARASFEFPPVQGPPLPGSAMPAAKPPFEPRPLRAATLKKATAGAPVSDKVSSAERNLTLSDLLSKGLLKPGAVLERTFRGGHKVTATITANGFITFEGHVYKTPSAAGIPASEGSWQFAEKPRIDGWRFWSTKRDGKLVSLKDLRRQAAEFQ